MARRKMSRTKLAIWMHKELSPFSVSVSNYPDVYVNVYSDLRQNCAIDLRPHLCKTKSCRRPRECGVLVKNYIRERIFGHSS